VDADVEATFAQNAVDQLLQECAKAAARCDRSRHLGSSRDSTAIRRLFFETAEPQSPNTSAWRVTSHVSA